MTSSTPAVNTVELLNLQNKDHSLFMFELAYICQDDFLNDHNNDIILLMNHYERAINNGNAVAFLCKKKQKNCGIVWVEIDDYGVGRIRAGMMPEYRKGFTAYNFLRLFINYCFTTLKLRKLDAEIVMGEKLCLRKGGKTKTKYAPMSRTTQAAEKLLRRFGFEKEGQPKEALLINGKPRDTLLLAITRNRYEGLKNVKRWKKEQQQGTSAA